MPKQLHHLKLPRAVYERSNVFTSSSTLVFVYFFFIVAIPAGVKSHLLVVLTCIFPITNDREHLSMGSLAIFIWCMLILSIRSKIHIYKCNMISRCFQNIEKNIFKKHTKLSMVIIFGE